MAAKRPWTDPNLAEMEALSIFGDSAWAVREALLDLGDVDPIVAEAARRPTEVARALRAADAQLKRASIALRAARREAASDTGLIDDKGFPGWPAAPTVARRIDRALRHLDLVRREVLARAKAAAGDLRPSDHALARGSRRVKRVGKVGPFRPDGRVDRPRVIDRALELDPAVSQSPKGWALAEIALGVAPRCEDDPGRAGAVPWQARCAVWSQEWISARKRHRLVPARKRRD